MYRSYRNVGYRCKKEFRGKTIVQIYVSASGVDALKSMAAVEEKELHELCLDLINDGLKWRREQEKRERERSYTDDGDDDVTGEDDE